MNLAKFATANVKPILFSVAVLGLIGIASYNSFPVSILPDVTFPRVVVIAEAGERPTQSVEASITRPLEEALTTIPNVRRIRSQTERGSSELSIDFAWGTDITTAEQLVNTKVNETRSSLPPETHTETERMNPTVFPVLGLTLDSDTLSATELHDLATYKIRPRLARVEGVSRVVVQGGLEPEVIVNADPNKLRGLKLSVSDIVQALGNANQIREVGRIDSRKQQLHVMVDDQTNDQEGLGRIVVATRGSAPILLNQVATIERGAQDRTTVVSANGHECVLLNVVRQPTANTVAMALAVKTEVDALRASLPKGVVLSTFYDQSIVVSDAVQSVGEAVLIGAGLSVVVLLLFLHNIRATLVTAAIIPMTVTITFLLMRIAGLTLNLMTLGALAVGIGLVIDDAIVVVENIFKHLSQEKTLAEAVASASTEIARPMISSTLTTVVVFLPLSLLDGVAGAFFSALALTLTIALIVSLALALLASPSLCAAFLENKAERATGPVFSGVLKGYERVLGFSIRFPWVVPFGAIATVLATLFIGTRLQTGFMPAMDEGAFVLDYTSPPGTALAESDRLLRKVDEILKATPEIASFSRRTGTELGFSITEPNRGDYAVMLKQRRSRKIDEVISDIRSKITDDVPGLDVDFSQVLQDLIGDLAGEPAPIDIKLFGENKEQIEGVAKSLAKELGQIKGLADIKSGVVELGPDWNLKLNPGATAHLGLSPSSVADQAEAGLLGTLATKMLIGDRVLGVRVRYPEKYRSDLRHIGEVQILTPLGGSAPLSAMGSFSLVPGTTESFRENQRRDIDVTANLEGIDLGAAISKVQGVLAEQKLPPGVTYTLGGQFKSQTESFAKLITVLELAILLVFGVMLFQFRSFTAPIVVLLVMPLGLFGAVLGLWASGTALNVSSFMGAIMLVGIVVKNGILLLDRAQEAEMHGMTPSEAVLDAGRQRLRPILMTSLTAILGLLPLSLGLGAGSEMQKPLAITVIGGLTFSTIVTLIAAPTLYVLFRKFRKS